MTLSGNWRVSLLSASGVEVVPDVVELILDGKHTEYPIEGKKIKNAETGNEEVELNISKTFYLYGTHADSDLQVVLKKEGQVLSSIIIPHDKAEASEEWKALKDAEGRDAGKFHFKSQWVSKIYVTPTGTNALLIGAYVLLFFLWSFSNVIFIPTSPNLVATTVCIIYIGCHRSLRLRDKGAIPEDEQETISSEDAYKFPLVGSSVLFGLYLLFKFFNKEWVNLLLSLYFSVVGCYLLTVTFSPFVSLAVTSQHTYGKVLNLPLLGHVDLRMTPAEIISGILSTVFSAVYFKTKHWVMNNVFGIAFAIQGIERISLGSYKVGAILLTGLFFYDIFWVFGTEVMVTVAKSFDAPIKLLFPRQFPTAETKMLHSMLGLGDIVIPGIFVALLIRYDAERASISPQSSPFAVFSKRYFNVCMVGYALGLITTIVIMNKFNAAQPALLYLVPACLISSLGTAVVLGDLKGLFAYSEEEEHHAGSTAAGIKDGNASASSSEKKD